MSDKRPVINLPGCGWLELLIIFTFGGFGGLVAMLVIGLNKGKPIAYSVLGGLVTLALVIVGGCLVLFVIWFAHMMERGREKREQERWIANAKENMALMQLTAKTQAQQNQMLVRQGHALARALPSPGDTLNVDALVFDNAVFEELED